MAGENQSMICQQGLIEAQSVSELSMIKDTCDSEYQSLPVDFSSVIKIRLLNEERQKNKKNF